jgi:post-segregation antitoxin (ccd killing protein)
MAESTRLRQIRLLSTADDDLVTLAYRRGVSINEVVRTAITRELEHDRQYQSRSAGRMTLASRQPLVADRV